MNEPRIRELLWVVLKYYYPEERKDFCEENGLSLDQIVNNTTQHLRGLTSNTDPEREHIFLTLRELYEQFLPSSCMAQTPTSSESPQIERFHLAPLAAESTN